MQYSSWWVVAPTNIDQATATIELNVSIILHFLVAALLVYWTQMLGTALGVCAVRGAYLLRR